MENSTLEPTPPTGPKLREPPLPGPKPKEAPVPGTKKEPPPVGPKVAPPVPGAKPKDLPSPGPKPPVLKDNSDETKQNAKSMEALKSPPKSNNDDAERIDMVASPTLELKDLSTPTSALKEKSQLGNSQFHGSIEVLNAKQLASSTKGKWEEPQSATTGAEKVPKMQALVEQLSQQQSASDAPPVDLSEHTGYKSSKVPKSSVDESSPTLNRIQSRTINRENTVRSPSKGPESKSFKHWYLNSLKSHDSPKTPLIDQSDVPKSYTLETIFGVVEENCDPYERMLWMARCFSKLKSVPHWRKAQREITNLQSDQGSNDVETEPKLDARNVQLLDLKIDTSSELRKIESGKVETLINSLIFPLDQGRFINRHVVSRSIFSYLSIFSKSPHIV